VTQVCKQFPISVEQQTFRKVAKVGSVNFVEIAGFARQFYLRKHHSSIRL
jgi:hypothetical protein